MSMLSSEEFWGCKLDASNRKVTWEYEDDDTAEHKLVVSQACLGAEAKDGERNVVNVTVTDVDEDDTKTHTILSLRAGTLEQCSISIGFTSTVTFELVSGSGPIHLVGSHLLAIEDDDEEGSFSGDSDGEDSDLSECDSCSDDEDVEDLGEFKGDEKSAKKRNKNSDNNIDHKKLKVAAGSSILKKTSEDIDEDSDEEDSDGMDIDDNSMNDSTKKSPVKKGKQGDKKVSFSNKVDVKTIPSKNSTNEVDVEKVKASIIKLKTKPKTIEKLKNFVKATHKITDPAIISDIWNTISSGK